MEGITYLNQNQYYITAEEFAPLKSALYRLDTDHISGLNSIEEKGGLIYPNPSSNVVHIEFDDISRVEIYDLHGELQKISSNQQIYISDLSKGMYIIIIYNARGDKSVIKKLIIN